MKNNAIVDEIPFKDDISQTMTESDSDNSTPTRVIGTSNPALENIKNSLAYDENSTTCLSRPQSVVLTTSHDKSIESTPRPKTAHISSHDISSQLSTKSVSNESFSNDNFSSPISLKYHDDKESATGPDDISSNSIEDATESEMDEDFLQNIKSILNTPKSHTESTTSTDLQSINKFEINGNDELNYMARNFSPERKTKPRVFRCKKISPLPKSSIPTRDKSKPSEKMIAARRNEIPKDTLAQCIEQMDSPDWEIIVKGIQTFLRLIRHQPQLVESQIHLVTIALSKQIKSLRSQVARSACKAAAEFFITHQKPLEHESEDLSLNLLGRTADTNKFLRADATRALEMMCDNLTPSKVIHILSTRGSTHLNAAVRTTTAKLYNRLVSKLGCDKVFQMNRDCRDKLILNCANLLLEGSLDTRNYAKDVFRQLSVHNSYNKVIHDVIPQRTYRNIEKALKSINK